MKVTLITRLDVEEIQAICQELEAPDRFYLFGNLPFAGISPDGDFWWTTTQGNQVMASVGRDLVAKVKINARRHALHESLNPARAGCLLRVRS